MEGQINLFNLDMSYADYHCDRYGEKAKVPKWMNYKRCENCVRWIRLDTSEQPPSGWGTYGFCQENLQRCGSCSYCQSFEDKRKVEVESEWKSTDTL